ncbi:hypothetical protein GUJ93_ZPchr0010g9572 [Zizania palustris]|uniref:Uncharacterized protein n=1 Tax=Zizania palustris TaxID=103762 RepID=A0A8J6BJX9_ZIZPA|nr:hypothetical protein GUJ93_ZPchr0010g9572 [Zizania palustris]
MAPRVCGNDTWPHTRRYKQRRRPEAHKRDPSSLSSEVERGEAEAEAFLLCPLGLGAICSPLRAAQGRTSMLQREVLQKTKESFCVPKKYKRRFAPQFLKLELSSL